LKNRPPGPPEKLFIIIDFFPDHPVYYYVSANGLN
jgi:hypothetical protein